LKAVWINDEPVFILYQPKLINDPGDPATTQ
jgi:hypothetical protein